MYKQQGQKKLKIIKNRVFYKNVKTKSIDGPKEYNRKHHGNRICKLKMSVYFIFPISFSFN